MNPHSADGQVRFSRLDFGLELLGHFKAVFQKVFQPVPQFFLFRLGESQDRFLNIRHCAHALTLCGSDLRSSLPKSNCAILRSEVAVSFGRWRGLSRLRRRVSLHCMSATLTIDLDADVLHDAEEEAKARQTTLPEVVARQLRVMARNRQESRAGRTPLTDSLRGAVKLPPDFEERTALAEELQKKHGVQG